MDLADVERDAGSGGISTELVGESSMASPRWIPAPDSPPLSTQLPPDSSAGDKGAASASFDCKRAPSQASKADTANYDLLPHGQLHELRNQRGYQKKETKAAIWTRLAAMDAANNKNADGS